MAVNNRGQVVGRSNTGEAVANDPCCSFTFVTHPFLYENGVMTDFGTLGGPSSGAKFINDRGDVVGRAANSAGSFRFAAVLWRRVESVAGLP